MVNHFGATGVVFNPQGRVLMVLHKKLGVWLPPGGHVEENELPDDACLREIFEETGIRAKLRHPSRLDLTDGHARELATPVAVLLEDIEGNGMHNHIDLVYVCEAEEGKLTPDSREVKDVRWFSVEEVMGLDTYDNVRQVIGLAGGEFNTVR